MKAMLLKHPGEPLQPVQLRQPSAGPGELTIQVSACAVCRTDLHLANGELPEAKYPLIPGHEIVGRIVAQGPGTGRFRLGARVGVPWLGWTCGACPWCQSGAENLCPQAKFTGCTLPGGFAEFVVAQERFCLALPDHLGDAEAAPLLCAGLIGYRCLVKAGKANRLGLFGFGAAAHLLTQVARFEGRKVFAFTRPGDNTAQDHARQVGVVWAGGSDQRPPAELDAAIIFAPVGPLVPTALALVRRGGTVVCGGIHMSDIPQFPYSLLWGERTLCSVANLTRRDGDEFLALAARIGLKPRVTLFPLDQANEALAALRQGSLTGAAVLTL
jgi:alcohol dehydrogenase, propanol-preferring